MCDNFSRSNITWNPPGLLRIYKTAEESENEGNRVLDTTARAEIESLAMPLFKRCTGNTHNICTDAFMKMVVN